MARRTLHLVISLLLIAALTGCMAQARTANLYTEEELMQRAEEISADEPEIIEITAAPTQPVTPYLVTPSPTPTPTPTPSPTPSPSPTPAYTVESMDGKKGYLNAGVANLRVEPNTECEIIRELERSARLTVTGACGEWYRVEAGEDTGFVLAEFVEFGAPPTAKPTATPTKKPSATPTPGATATSKPTSTPDDDEDDSPSGGNGYTAEELLLIAQVVHQEAKGTSFEGHAAVANVIYNRIRSSRFPSSVEGVIFQKNQFTVADNEAKLRAVNPSSTAVAAVEAIFVDEDTFLPSDVMYFRAASKGTSWGSSYKYYDTFGGNCFFSYIG